MKKAIFIDFDGTITKTDTCSAMVQAFAGDGWQEINKLWEDKKLSTADCANMTFKLFDATPEDIKNLMETMEIDEYFKDFMVLCKDRGHDVYILSDGYDFNIQTILKKFDINIKYFANEMLFDNEKGFRIHSPYENIKCKNCGTCKTNLIKTLAGKGDQIVYIGDSYSDMCPVEIADTVFAKGILFGYCREKGIHAHRYTSFKDIISSGIL